MMIPNKQIVYLREIHHKDWLVKSYNGDLIDYVKQSEGYFFTPEQLNEYTQSVIKEALETAAANAKTIRNKDFYMLSDVNKQSIIKTFGKIYKKLKV